MFMNIPSTRFVRFTKREALLVLCMVALVMVYGIASLSQAFPHRERDVSDGEDARMYQSMIERIHSGEAYYQIVGEELRSRGYASRPFFNWRLPTIAWTIGHLPQAEWGRWMLMAVAGLTLIFWFQVLDRERGFLFALAGSVLLCGPLILSVSEKAFYYHELWAGLMIAFSLAAYARGNIGLSVFAGMLALFIRELALPYVLIMFALAWKQGRREETLGWLAGLTLFSMALTWHASIVSQLLTPLDQVNESWVQFGGWPFVLSTGNWNAFLLAAPHWVVAVVLPLALLGIVGWNGAAGFRGALTLGAYCAAYLIAGRANNAYWGMMYAPLVSIGLLYALPSIIDLAKAMFLPMKRVSS